MQLSRIRASALPDKVLPMVLHGEVVQAVLTWPVVVRAAPASSCSPLCISTHHHHALSARVSGLHECLFALTAAANSVKANRGMKGNNVNSFASLPALQHNKQSRGCAERTCASALSDTYFNPRQPASCAHPQAGDLNVVLLGVRVLALTFWPEQVVKAAQRNTP